MVFLDRLTRPCIKSAEYRRLPFTMHLIVPPLLINTKHSAEIILGIWLTVLVHCLFLSSLQPLLDHENFLFLELSLTPPR